ncbi:MAG: methylenetetrahydrofolate reductase [NAD(P)H] [Gammaproteobacteria bacterium]|nr:methylenetetrahydrofolate reductase [NAD(P)H] [Gammaproteobacteria bacterium]
MKPSDKNAFQSGFSIEFFPPRTEQGREKLLAVHDRLAALKPEFYSVTYGAGGSTREGTRSTVMALKERGSQVAPHLSFGGSSDEEVLELLNGYQRAGINRLVALRGDIPSGLGSASQHRYASELVEFVRRETGDYFYIDVACYPEIHPDAPDYTSDIEYFKVKADAGADSAITQYFFNPDAYFYFVDQCRNNGITIPIVPGIMPITNYANLARFSNNCGAEIPRWIRQRLESYGDDVESVRSFGIDVATALCENLLAGGAPGLHFYAMNQATSVIAIWQNLDLSNR